MKRNWHRVLISLTAMILFISSATTALAETGRTNAQRGLAEATMSQNAVLYSGIERELYHLKALNPSRMRYEVIGQSLEGRDLYLVTISDAQGIDNLSQYQQFMQAAVNNPETAKKLLQANSAKIPVFFNASIHGNETTGTDGVLQLISKLQTDESFETRKILKNCIVLINVCQNPDGRVSGYRENASGTDLNRDFITQSQPEVQAVVSNVATKWFPTAMLDLHGYMGSGNVLLEPCTGPHNPNYEYDLTLKYSLPHAEAIASDLRSLFNRKVDIPYKEWKEGWDDYPPIFASQYFMYLGAVGHTLEVKFPNQQGVNTVSAACYASLKYLSGNKIKLMKNQFSIYERGVKGLSVEKDMIFPAAYLIPMEEDRQRNPLEAAEMIRHLLDNRIIVKQAQQPFFADGREYPAGTYVIPMNQGLRGLVNTMLWKAENVSKRASTMYDISAYSFPLLCGFDATAACKPFDAILGEVRNAPLLRGSLEAGAWNGYLLPVENNHAYQAVNELVRSGIDVYRTAAANEPYGAGSFYIPKGPGVTADLEKLAAEYAIHIKGISTVWGKLQPVRLLKTAVIGNDGGTATVMKEMGFDVTPVPYYEVNNGYDLQKHGFEAIVVSGMKDFWENSYDVYGTTWSLDEVGRKEVIRFAKKHDYIGVGYAGAKLNEEVGKLRLKYMFTGTEEDGQTAENGICILQGSGADPVTYHFGGAETVFTYGPVWFGNLSRQAEVSARYGKKDFYLAGFWKNPKASAGAPAILHDNSSAYDAVLFGIEPAFRSYTPGTYGLMANALYYLGYDE